MTRIETFNGLRHFPLAGRYFELLSTVQAVDVVFYDKNDQVISTDKQVEEGFFVDRRGLKVDETGKLVPVEPFVRFEITTQANEAVKFQVTDGYSGQRSALADVTDRGTRLLGIVYGTLGQLAQVLVNGVNYLRVQVQGKGDAETDAGKAFMGFCSVGSVGGQYGYAQVLNPAASGKTVYVDAVLAANASSSFAFLHNTALGTLVGTLKNKDSGAAASTATMRTENSANSSGPDNTGISLGYISDTTWCEKHRFEPPIKLAAGEGLTIRTGSVAQANNCGFEIREY